MGNIWGGEHFTGVFSSSYAHPNTRLKAIPNQTSFPYGFAWGIYGLLTVPFR